jgi:mono/diheme cytochrome c family protein/cytochrome c2
MNSADHNRKIVRADLGVTRLLRVFCILSIVFVVALAIAPARTYFTEWRESQLKYNAVVAPAGQSTLDPGIQQIWKPNLGVVDRCTSCHVGMGAAEPNTNERLFASHPPIPHDPRDIGCTLCHGGQGRATQREAAHGHVQFWEEPLLERPYFEAGCGTCHTHLPVASLAAAERGASLFRRYDCVACHRLDGVGRGTGPDLSFSGIRGFRLDWYDMHLQKRHLAGKGGDGAWLSSFGAIPEGDLSVLQDFMASRVGASKLARGKQLAFSMGCRSCHKINGVGGDDGPDLTLEGRRSPEDLDFRGVSGEHTLSNWLTQHFLEPAKVVPGSLMPSMGFSREDAESLTLFMLSQRGSNIPEAYWPPDRIRAVRLKQREFAPDGRSLFGVFCAGCHGVEGAGRRYASSSIVFPSVGNPDFIQIASDDYLRATITHGRSGRRMPAWGEKDGGLTPTEIDSIITYLRSRAPGSPEKLDIRLPKGSVERGEKGFARTCASCHGPRATDGEAPAIAHPQFLAAATDEYIAASVLRGRTGTSMRHFGLPTLSFPTLTEQEISDIIAWLRKVGSEGVTRKE